MKRSVSVQIAGVRYSLKTDEDERWVKSIAAFVDTKMRDVQKHTRTVDTQSVAVLAALQVAEELFAERRDARELRKSIREKSQSLLDYLEREARV
ncbi:MAG TPA: cell division protein ZapA [Polyangia bacterium]|nr:cell division protein ZapA [Polyangia bacterium]HTA18097.1 cell division protein ZapA [Polyangia bacterium]